MTHHHVFIIAEAGSNWRMGTPKRDREMARALIEVAAEAGADAVKFQTYRPETVYAPGAGQSDYLSDAGIQEDIHDIFADLSMPYEMVPELADYTQQCGLEFMTTPFSLADFAAVDPYVSRHKIASYELTHRRLIEAVATSGKPLIMSTGGSDEADIAWAVDHYRAEGGTDLTLMQCTAAYPAPLETLNLRVIPWLMERFSVAGGFSDHSRHPTYGPAAAVALGATVIEKHYTLQNRLPGPDHAFAVEPDELKAMVDAIRATEAVLGDGIKQVQDAERELYGFAQRAVQATCAITKGEVLQEGKNIDILRAGKQSKGVHSQFIDQISGSRAMRNIAAGEGIGEGDWQREAATSAAA